MTNVHEKGDDEEVEEDEHDDNINKRDRELKREIWQLRRSFEGRLIVIDEVHNIIGRDDNDLKRVSTMLLRMVKHCRVKLLFLSATPMYNSNREIIWLTNVMNMNDRRSTIKYDQVFDEGAILSGATDIFVKEVLDASKNIIKESGQDLLSRKLLGYVSFVRGENPYVFPFRIYPALFANQTQIIGPQRPYPRKQINNKDIKNPIKFVPVYLTSMG